MYARHREKRKQESREYWRARPELNRARSKAWRLANPERANETKRRYREAHPEFVQRWTAWANWRRRGVNAPDAIALDYRAILTEDTCSYCGAACEHIDHIDALSENGQNVWSNLTASCQPCNYSKSARPLLTFLLDRSRSMH